MGKQNKTYTMFMIRVSKVYIVLLLFIFIILSSCVADSDAVVQQESVMSSAEPTENQQVFLQDSDSLQSATLMPIPTLEQLEKVTLVVKQTLTPVQVVISTPAPKQTKSIFPVYEPNQQVLSFTMEPDVLAGEMTGEEAQFLPLVIHQGDPTPTPTLKQPILMFSDEFKGTSLDLEKWETRYPWGGTLENNGELECYSPNSVSVKDGILKLTAIKKNVTCLGMDGQTKNLPYRSGMIASHGFFSFEYGFVEVRAKVPAGPGLWPAFWLLPEVEAPITVEWPPEIDIMEILGNEPTKVYMGNWGGTEFDVSHYAGDYRGPDFSADFHVFGLSWEPDLLIWYVDGVERFRSDQEVPTVPMYLIVNLAVGGNWPGSPNQDTEFPSTLEVDYIRVYDVGF